MIVLIRCNDIISDSRAKKYIDYFIRKDIDYRIIAWDRLSNSVKQPKTIYCPSRSKYNQGGLAAAMDRIKWMLFIIRTLFSFKENLTIHACDIDAAFPAVIYKMFSKRKNYVLFDIFDWISDTLYNQGRIMSLAFGIMEYVAVKKSDHIIICEEERIQQVPYNIKGKYSVLQNIPSFKSDDFLYDDKKYHFENDKLVLSYVGGFVEDRCLDELIEGAEQGLYNLNIAGYGKNKFLDKLSKLSSCPNIKYYGKVAYKDGLRIMYNSDMIYAMYSKANPNHFYAAPNKYYEALFLGKALITTSGIIVAKKVIDNNIGYACGESFEELKNLISSITKEDLQTKSNNAKLLWGTFSEATEQYLDTVYTKEFLLKERNLSEF